MTVLFSNVTISAELLNTQRCKRSALLNNVVQRHLLGNYRGCWADICLLGLFPEALRRQLSKLWRLVRNELMTGTACLSFFRCICLFAENSQLWPGASVEAWVTARTGPSPHISQLFVFSHLFYCLQPSATTCLLSQINDLTSPHVNTHRRGLCGCVARHMAPSCHSRLISRGLTDIKQW